MMEDVTVTILHVEDDPLLTHLVRTAFLRFGFRGDMINAGSVAEAMQLLGERAKTNRPVNLIILDMQLPDGNGLDLIRETKTDPALRATPIIVLSHDVGEGMINDAYALGASSYLTKMDASETLLGSLQSLYEYWLKNVKLPRPGNRDRLQETLERAIALRSRTSEFYLRVSRAFPVDPAETAFWLARAMNEANLSNLLAFFRNRVREKDAPGDTIGRFSGMQSRVKHALKTAEGQLQAEPAPSPEQAYAWALSLVEPVEEELFAEVLGILFPKGSVATAALKVRAGGHILELASHIQERTDDRELRDRAAALLDWARRLMSVRDDEK
jgi:chemotaxis family two-component system response regulator Rcp1